MLKTRIVAVLLVKGGIVVQSVEFSRYLPVGAPAIALEYLNLWGVDEIVLLDIDATPEGRSLPFDRIGGYSQYCRVPLAVGGGIKSPDDMRRAIQAGADKIVINTAAFTQPELIRVGADLCGSQCIVVAIDARRGLDSRYEAYVNSGRVPTGCTPAELAARAEQRGAGEVLLTSIGRDGSKAGYDPDLVRQVMQVVHIPVIVCGGANHPRDFQAGIDLGASAVAAANMFHHSEHSVTVAKAWLRDRQANLRPPSYVTYEGFDFDSLGRLRKKDDALLERLFVEHTPQEVI